MDDDSSLDEDAGKSAADFAELLQGVHRDLYVFIFSLVQNRTDAEDVYQQTTLVLWTKFAEFTPGTNFAAWATRVAHLTARHFIKNRRRRHLYFSDDMLESLYHAYQHQEADRCTQRADALSKCLEKLSARERKLIDRCYADDGGVAQVASAENRSLASIYQAIYRVRKNLFNCVERSIAAESR